LTLHTLFVQRSQVQAYTEMVQIFIMDITNKCTRIKMHTFTYNLQRHEYISIILRSFSGNWHQTSI